jgi:hypothetical protein
MNIIKYTNKKILMKYFLNATGQNFFPIQKSMTNQKINLWKIEKKISKKMKLKKMDLKNL